MPLILRKLYIKFQNVCKYLSLFMIFKYILSFYPTRYYWIMTYVNKKCIYMLALMCNRYAVQLNNREVQPPSLVYYGFLQITFI